MKLFNKYLATTALIAGLAGAASAETIVSEIDVNADFGALETQMATDFWPTVEADLKAKLAERLAPMAGEDGVEIDVSIRELALNAAATTATYSDLNAIDGVVAIRGPEEDDPTTSFRIAYSVVAPEGVDPMPGVIVLPADTTDNYAALLDTIVDEVEKQVRDYNM